VESNWTHFPVITVGTNSMCFLLLCFIVVVVVGIVVVIVEVVVLLNIVLPALHVFCVSHYCSVFLYC